MPQREPGDPIEPFRRLEPIEAGKLNRMREFARMIWLRFGRHFTFRPRGSGWELELLDPDELLWIRLSGASSPYSWTHVRRTAAHAWGDHPSGMSGTANATEVNGISGLNNVIVPAWWEADSAGLIFNYRRTGGCPSTIFGSVHCVDWTGGFEYCINTPIPDATVELRKAADPVGSGLLLDTTTSGGPGPGIGQYSFGERAPGDYDIVASRAGYRTSTTGPHHLGTCEDLGIPVAICLEEITINVNVMTCCPVEGASVVLSGFASASGTTDVAGNVAFTIDSPEECGCSEEITITATIPAGMGTAETTQSVTRKIGWCRPYFQPFVFGPSPDHTQICCNGKYLPRVMQYSDEYGSCELIDGRGSYTFTTTQGAGPITCPGYTFACSHNFSIEVTNTITLEFEVSCIGDGVVHLRITYGVSDTQETCSIFSSHLFRRSGGPAYICPVLAAYSEGTGSFSCDAIDIEIGYTGAFFPGQIGEDPTDIPDTNGTATITGSF